MVRLACVDLPFFALQLLFRRHPEWMGFPSAVVAAQSPQGEILEVNEKARARGILPGFRYGAALALAPSLRAEVVSELDRKDGVEDLVGRLTRFSPDVEAVKGELGAFYLKASGLWRLYRSPEHWAQAISKYLLGLGFKAYVAVGYTRFGTLALARAGGQLVVAPESPEQEALAAREVRLDRLGLPPKQRDLLSKLGIRTVGGLLDLPPDGLLERFGVDLYQLYGMAQKDVTRGLEKTVIQEPIADRVYLDEPENNRERLIFLTKRTLRPLLEETAERHLAVSKLKIELKLERTMEEDRRVESVEVRPAAPTLEDVQLVDLARLKLESLEIKGGVIEFALELEAVKAEVEQLLLFAQKPKRDLDAAGRAVARLQAEFGEGTVVKAVLKEGHLPEATFSFEDLDDVVLPKVHSGESKMLIRRLWNRPVPLQPRPVVGPRGCHLLGMGHEPFSHLIGPYVVSGGWWVREVQREYYFVGTDSGHFLFVYFDKWRRRWFVHGMVE